MRYHVTTTAKELHAIITPKSGLALCKL